MYFQLIEMFGAGTACVVCPIKHILYGEKDVYIPTMKNGAKITKRFYQDLTDIQVCFSCFFVLLRVKERAGQKLYMLKELITFLAKFCQASLNLLNSFFKGFSIVLENDLNF